MGQGIKHILVKMEKITQAGMWMPRHSKNLPLHSHANSQGSASRSYQPRIPSFRGISSMIRWLGIDMIPDPSPAMHAQVPMATHTWYALVIRNKTKYQRANGCKNLFNHPPNHISALIISCQVRASGGRNATTLRLACVHARRGRYWGVDSLVLEGQRADVGMTPTCGFVIGN